MTVKIVNMEYARQVPIFKLYGGHDEWPTPDLVHCETIASRSKLHNWHIRPHRHTGLYQILYLHQGNAIVQLDERRHRLAGRQVVEVPQTVVHGFEFDHDCQGYVMTIAYPLLTQLSRNLDESAPLPSLPHIHVLERRVDQDTIRNAFTRLNAEYTARAPYRGIQIEALLTLIYVWLRRNRPIGQRLAPRPRSHEHFSRFGELLDQSHTTHHDVAYYARTLGITPAHLNVITRNQADKSPLELIHERLLLEASRSLVYTSMTISEISYELGFSDPAYFTRFFKKASGVSPKAFRQRAGT
ncbi:helix-turn-helix domain-containing protein [Castellaniella sp. GW247-6E4]|uniref:helix-turn-helix domain-containing protein n=1 Tax=Castellaniella sp. GW247-6E4 TaxID=3140380 RepID=UPI003314D6F4